jgi:DNA-binding protein HU-beta
LASSCMIIGMTRRQQIDAVAHAAGLTYEQARMATDAVASVIKVGLLEQGRVQLSGLGTFHVLHRRPRRAFNPSTGVHMDLPASASVTFRPTLELREQVKQLARSTSPTEEEHGTA